MRRLTCVALLFCAASLQAYEAGKFYSEGHTKEKVIALTLDDGPGAFTPEILALLKEHKIRATFFIEGDQVASYPQALQQVHAAGHELGNHTYYHTNYRQAMDHPAEHMRKELEMTEAAIAKALGDPHFKTDILRMPYGAYGKYNRDWLIPLLKERGYALIAWTYGSDWVLLKKRSAEQIAADYIHNAHPGAIFLFHDGGRHREKTLAALKIVLPALEAKGYRFVAAGDLLNTPDEKGKSRS